MIDNYKDIPIQYRFDYIRTEQRIKEIRESIKGFAPTNNEEFLWLKNTLKEYHTLFCHLRKIDEKIKQIV